MDRIDPTQDTMVIKPRRVYKCEQENRTMSRKDVWKDAFGKFHCSSCSGEVKDVTDTETGKNLMEIMGL
jgi:hypothetical protein